LAIDVNKIPKNIYQILILIKCCKAKLFCAVLHVVIAILNHLLLKDIIKRLQEKKPIDPIHDIHPPHGPLLGYKAIHIKSDWILVFKIEEPFLILVMLGTHSQAYEK